VQLLQELQGSWVAGIQGLAAMLAPGGSCEQLLRDALLQQLLPLLQLCTPEHAVARIVLAFAPELAAQPYISEALNSIGLQALLKLPGVQAALANRAGRGFTQLLRDLLTEGYCCRTTGVSLAVMLHLLYLQLGHKMCLRIAVV
jgi:hypothetical protein